MLFRSGGHDQAGALGLLVFRRQLGEGLVVELAGAGGLEGHQLAEVVGVLGVEDLPGRHVEALQLVDRQVDATAAGVLAHVADDVGELEGKAEVVGVFERLAVGVAEDLGRQQADHAGHPVAVEVEGLPVEVAGLVEVHLHAVDDFEQLLHGQREALDDVLERLADRVLGLAAEHLAHLVAPPVELGLGDLQVVAFVHHVVDLAAEGVEGGDRLAPLGRQEHEAVVEAGAAAGGFFLAVGVGVGHGGLPGGGAPDEAQPVCFAEGRAAGEHVVADPFDLVENCQPTLHHQAELPADAAGHFL